jgi:hypothetical protein
VQRKEEARAAAAAASIAARTASARYVPGGRAQHRDLQKSSLDACLINLHATLSRDWPVSFVQVRDPLFDWQTFTLLVLSRSRLCPLCSGIHASVHI